MIHTRKREVHVLCIEDNHTGKKIKCPYALPQNLKTTVQINVVEVEVAGRDPKPVEYLNTGQYTKDLTLFFDASDEKNGDVSEKIEIIKDMASHPLTIYFPTGSVYKCFITSLTIDESLLNYSNSKPVRATAEIKIIGRK